MSSDIETRTRNVTAVLGPTNTGKTHLAIERMLGHETGMIGLPLRLLAREVYDKIVARVGAGKVALITGEEKIRPENPRFWVSTVEAMPREVTVDFLAIDEIQLCADPERGHVFTDRLLHARGRQETLLLGAGTMREAVSELVPGANFISRPRLSKLTYSGEKKITRLPKRTAIVTFSAGDVYQIAELIRRQIGGAAVVLGALSPRTRNAQVELYQSGDVDYIVATDAIGMGLNLDVDHVAFAATRKFDGQNHRNLTPGELAQVAGRAGRHMNDGTFGVTGDVKPFDPDIIERLETHNFDTIRTLQWRSRELDFSSVDALRESLRQMPREQRLTRARMADDVLALEAASADPEVLDMARGRDAVAMLWDVCQIPDYRKISNQNHAELVTTVFKYLRSSEGRIPEDWFAKQVAFSDRIDGDIDTLANRIAHIRTWTFVSNRAHWLSDPAQWQDRTRAIEDSLSDALHACLTQRFVDRRTSALMKGLRDKEELSADIGDDGAIMVENHYVGRLKGFRFTPEAVAEGIQGKATRQAAAQVVAKEVAMRVRRITAAKPDAFRLSRQARILWRGDEVARIEPGEDPLRPQVVLLADEHLSGPDRDRVQERLNTWIIETVKERLKPLVDIAAAEDITGLARGIAYRLTENLGVLKRESIADELKSLDQNARAQLRKHGVRFGAFNVYFPMLLKPAAAELRVVLWALKHAATAGLTIEALPDAPRAGLTSIVVDPTIPEPFYRVYGYHLCGPRVVRMDILERLADLIRPLVAWRPPAEGTATPPKGSTGNGGFVAIPEMMSILGCSAEELGGVLKTLGFWSERRPKQVAPPQAPVMSAQTDSQDGTVVGGAAETALENTTESAIAASGAVGEQMDQPSLDPVAEAATPALDEPAVDSATAPDVVSTEPVALTEESTVAAGQAASEQPSEPAVAASAGVGEPEPVLTIAADDEIAYEEVWRPRKRNKQQGRRPPERQGRDRPARTDHRTDHRSGQRSRAAAGSPDASAVVQTGAPEGSGAIQTAQPAPGDQQGEQQPGKGRDGGGRGDGNRGRDRQREGGGGGQKSDHRKGDQNRDRNRDQNRDRGRENRRPGDEQQRGGRNERPAIIARSGPSTKKGTVDPDSPFAALGALKQALEKRTREQGS